MKKIILGGAIALVVLAVKAERIELKTDCASCVVETRGARIMSFKPTDGEEVIWQADPVQVDEPKWAHGGIPVCWPWFGVNGKAEIHGTAWREEFEVVSRKTDGKTGELVLARTEGKIRVEVTVRLRDALKVELKTVNASDADYRFSAAFHPYFRVGERDRVEVGGVKPGTIRIDRAIDDVYPTAPGSCTICRIHDPEKDRTIYTYFENATGVNVWNPGAEKDCPGTVPGDEWRHYVCVEPMLGESPSPVTLKPGDFLTLMMGIEVRKGAKTSGYVGKDPRRPSAADEPTGRPFHVLYLGAHPDDFDYSLSAQAVKLVRAGAKVTAVAFCNGNKGHVDMSPEALAARRLKEAQAAAKVYGLERYIVLDSPDCELDATRAWRERIGRLVRDVAPDMVLTHRTVDYHSDHRAVGQIVQDLTYFLGVPHWCPDTPVPEKLPFVMYAVDDFTSPRRVRADLVMSAAGAIEEGARGLACHVSQLFEWMPPELGDDPEKLTAPDVRAAYALKLEKDYCAAHAKAYADVFEKAYGNRNEPAAVAELSEYSRAPSARELEFVESVPGFRWIGSRTLDILH